MTLVLATKQRRNDVDDDSADLRRHERRLDVAHWLQGIIRQPFCVLLRRYVVEPLIGVGVSKLPADSELTLTLWPGSEFFIIASLLASLI